MSSGTSERVLSYEIDPDPLGADQAGHLFDLVHQRLGGVIEQQVGFIEKEHQLRFVRIAYFGQFLEQLATCSHNRKVA